MRRLFRVRWMDPDNHQISTQLLVSLTSTDNYLVGVTLDGKGWTAWWADIEDMTVEVENYG